MQSWRNGMRWTRCLCAYGLSLAAGLMLWLGSTGSLRALDLGQPVHSYQLDRWYSDEGLPHNTVHTLSLSPEGYLWASTWEGLARYNGRTFTVFDSSSIPKLNDDGFRAVLVGNHGAIWGATARAGLLRHADGEWRQFGLEQGLSTLNLFSLDAAPDGVWVGSQDGGAMHVSDGGKVTVLRTSDGLYADWVQCVRVESDGSVWIGTARGLNLYARGKIEPSPRGLPDGVPIYEVMRDRVGRLWVAAETGLYYFEAGAFQRFNSGTTDLKAVSSLLQDRDGGFWIGTQSQGVFRFSERGLEALTTTDGLTNNRITALAEDHEGGIWIATNGGLNRISAATFSAVTRARGLRDEFVRSIHEGRAQIWIGTSQGVYRYADRSVSQPDFLRPLASSSIMAVLESRDGQLWAGTYDSGVARYDGKDWHWYGRAEGLPSNQVRVLFEARDGALWIGTSQGTQRLSEDSTANYSMKDGLPTDYTLSIAQLRNGSMLIGTSKGFARIDEGKITRFAADNGFPGTDVFAFLEDLSGTLWLGTYEGLVRMHDNAFRLYTREHGLPDSTVFAINEDGRGNLLLSTNAGLVRVARASMQADGVISDLTVFGRSDGMAGSQINGSSQPSTWRTRSGDLWLPTARGISVLNLARTGDRPQGRVSTVIEKISVDGGEYVPEASRVAIEPGKQRVRIDFAGLSFSHAARLSYRYRLLGFDEQWVMAGRETNASYTNLGPGRYRFEVQADFADFSTAPTTHVEFEVYPHVYQTVWFWLLVGLAAAACVLALHRFRVRALHRRERELEAQVASRTEELSRRNQALELADHEKSNLLNTIQVQAQAFARQAREDALTGLANRRHFDQWLGQEYSRRKELHQDHWVAVADLDHFKRINDSFSHQAGDDVLRATAAVLERCMQGHGMVARYGGEEFVFSFNSADRTEVLTRLERICAEVRALDFPAYPGLQVTISIGLNRNGRAAHHEKLISDADAQLYQAKHAGRNRVA